MNTPKDFEGKIEIPITNSFGFFPEDDNKTSFTVWFYRREHENGTLKEFLDSIVEENMGYDKPSNQLFYRSKSGKIYRVDFTEIR
jgi:hypothetical protein